MNQAQTDTCRQIKGLIARSLNGIVAEHIRRSGLGYEQTLGVDWVRLREIAAGFEPDRDIAHHLWLSPVREHKLIATLLCPKCDMDDAEISFWLDGATNSELAEILSFALLSRVPETAERLLSEVRADRRPVRLAAILALGRMARFEHSITAEQLDRARAAVKDEDRENPKFHNALESLS